ncbi:MAG: hypothetical protein AB7O59_19105 [Pirellulales bacterium]
MAIRPARSDHGLRFEHLETRHLLAAVVGRHIFYNDSAFDGDGAAMSAADDAAIDPSKTPYRPETAISVRQLTDNDTYDVGPQVHGAKIVWSGRGGIDGGTDDEIFLFDGVTTTQLTVNNSVDRFPKISALGVVWERGSGTSQEIIFYDGVTETPLTNNAVFDGAATLSDERVAWEQGSGNGVEIMTWKPSTAVTNISLNAVVDRLPSASGDRVAWKKGSTPNSQIVLFDGATSTPVASSTKAMDDPDMSGDWIAWSGFPPDAGPASDREIYLFDGTTTTRLTDNEFPEFAPQVSGTNVVWWGGVFNNFQIYRYDGFGVTQISTGTLNRYPQVAGPFIVWQSNDGHDEEIFLWNGQDVLQLTDNDFNDTNPQIHGEHLVWQAEFGIDGTTYEIFDSTIGAAPALYENLTNYSRGINGIMIDLSAGGLHGSITANDFIFKVGANNLPTSWNPAPAPTAITVRTGAGVSGSDRVEITWADGAIKNQWLEVLVLATVNTGLSATDAFFWGNRIGDTGSPTATSFTTTTADAATVLAGGLGSAGGITNVRDIDKSNTITVAGDRAATLGNIGALNRLAVPIGGAFGHAPHEVSAVAPLRAASGGDAGIASALAVQADRASSQWIALPGAALSRPLGDDDTPGRHALATRRPQDMSEQIAQAVFIEPDELPELLEGVDDTLGEIVESLSSALSGRPD